jgi:16S rRNA U516 pseudouridylate synthase RsuA-like enzyme
MWLAVGCDVVQLSRTRYGAVALPPDLRPGQWRMVPMEALGEVSRAPAGRKSARPPIYKE